MHPTDALDSELYNAMQIYNFIMTNLGMVLIFVVWILAKFYGCFAGIVWTMLSFDHSYNAENMTQSVAIQSSNETNGISMC